MVSSKAGDPPTWSESILLEQGIGGPLQVAAGLGRHGFAEPMQHEDRLGVNEFSYLSLNPGGGQGRDDLNALAVLDALNGWRQRC